MFYSKEQLERLMKRKQLAKDKTFKKGFVSKEQLNTLPAYNNTDNQDLKEWI